MPGLAIEIKQNEVKEREVKEKEGKWCQGAATARIEKHWTALKECWKRMVLFDILAYSELDE